MSNVLDLVDQTAFVGERAIGATNLLQCVWVYNRASTSAVCAVPSPSSAGAVIPPHRTLTVAVRPPSLGLAQRSARAGDRRDDLAPVKNSTPGSLSRPAPGWMPSMDPDGTLRCCRSPTAAPG